MRARESDILQSSDLSQAGTTSWRIMAESSKRAEIEQLKSQVRADKYSSLSVAHRAHEDATCFATGVHIATPSMHECKAHARDISTPVQQIHVDHSAQQAMPHVGH